MIEEYKVGEYGLENETEGMYARTNNGIIGKIINSNSDEMINGPELLVNNKIYCVERNSIKDIQKSIIDLLEVGDYVNGKLIHKIDKGQNYCYLYYGNCKTFVDYQIKTILTKETYEANCYTVEKVKD